MHQHDLERTAYRATVTNLDGMILVVISARHCAGRFSRRFRKICAAERWLTALARTGLTARAAASVERDRDAPDTLPPLGRIMVEDARTSKRMILPSSFT